MAEPLQPRPAVPPFEPPALPSLITESSRRILWIVGLYRAVCGALLLGAALFFDLRALSIAAPNAFVTAAGLYFLYGLLHPGWQMACGQLWAFLAYDLVLIVPYLLHFALARPEQLPSLLINTLVLVYSGTLAIYYLLVKQSTRTGRKSRQNPTAQELNRDDNFGPNAPGHSAEDDWYSGAQSNERVIATVMSSHLEGKAT